MGLRLRTMSRSLLIALPLLSVGISAPSHAASKPAYQTFKRGRSAGWAFFSLVHGTKSVRSVYQQQLKQQGVAEARNLGLLNVALVPVALTYAGGGGYQTVADGFLLKDAIARGNPAEIAGGAAMTLITGGFTAANLWFAKANVNSAKAAFASARAGQRAARQQTIDAVVGSQELQREINGGQVLSPPALQSLRQLRNAL